MRQSLPEPSIDSAELQRALFMFIDFKVKTIQDRYSEFFDNPRKYWGEDGRIAAEVDLARRETRQASAEDGFYTMFCPAELGGGGLGARLYPLRITPDNTGLPSARPYEHRSVGSMVARDSHLEGRNSRSPLARRTAGVVRNVRAAGRFRRVDDDHSSRTRW